ncbi:hypothetical protein [Actinoplanes solisilvae]|uniref:hypothetical protein n=1 Tax=Actinoplanes solisilvae TaxID=2486853 RepID=UPI000FD6FF7E|nr:hypothetical protein [Actinoplanes solisilvae]
MLFALMAFVVLAGMCSLPFIFGWYDKAAKKPHDVAEDQRRETRPESLEGVLVAQLVADEITRGQYHRAMAKIAARDDDRHPLAVPPSPGATAD